MEHSRHYTLEEASALLPRVVELIERMRSARDRLGDAEARAALAAVGQANGGGEPGRTVSEGFLELRESMLELREFAGRLPARLVRQPAAGARARCRAAPCPPRGRSSS